MRNAGDVVSQCPACQNELNDDFGLVDCNQCGAALFIEMDGAVRRRDGGGSHVQEPPPLDVGDESENSPEEEFAFAEAPSPEFHEIQDDIPLSPLAPVLQPQTEPPQGDQLMKELTNFGNSQTSSGREGRLFYDLEISGIDSSDLRQHVQEALNDPLFLWDVEEMVNAMHLGQLKIPKMTSVKAAMVVQRLTGLPLQIKWVQHALTDL